MEHLEPESSNSEIVKFPLRTNTVHCFFENSVLVDVLVERADGATFEVDPYLFNRDALITGLGYEPKIQ